MKKGTGKAAKKQNNQKAAFVASHAQKAAAEAPAESAEAIGAALVIAPSTSATFDLPRCLGRPPSPQTSLVFKHVLFCNN